MCNAEQLDVQHLHLEQTEYSTKHAILLGLYAAISRQQYAAEY